MTERWIVALDVDYRPELAVAAAIWFHDWADPVPSLEGVATFNEVAEYRPGEFYLRELPCLLGALELGPAPGVVIVDGYAWLGGDRPGLGARLRAALPERPVVVGVAKTRFAGAEDALPVCRGEGRSPLYVSADGADVAEAAEWARSMHGPFRVPTLLKRADQLARTWPG